MAGHAWLITLIFKQTSVRCLPYSVIDRAFINLRNRQTQIEDVLPRV
jgi:hypothetical protein